MAFLIEDVDGIIHIFQELFVTRLLFSIFQIGKHVIEGLGKLLEFPVIVAAGFKR